MPINRAQRVALACAIAFAGFAAIENARASMIHVSESPFCISAPDAKIAAEDFVKAHSRADLTIIGGETAKAWLDEFNAQMPSTDYRADELWVTTNPIDDADAITVAFFENGKSCSSVHISIGVFAAIERKAKEGAL